MAKGVKANGAGTRCPHCNFFTKNKVLLARHRKTCLKNFKKKDIKTDTIQDRTDGGDGSYPKKCNRIYKCNDCDKFTTMKSREYLQHRIDTHGEKINIHECDVCDYSNRYQFMVVRHSKIHRRLSQNARQKNSASAAESNTVDRSAVKKKVAWKIKAFSKTTKTSIKLSKRKDNSENEIKPTYRCSVCDFKTSKKIEFFAHKAGHAKPSDETDMGTDTVEDDNMSVHRGDGEAIQESEIKEVDATNEVFTCNECGEDYDTVDILKLHKMSHQLNTSFVCYICDLDYKQVADFSRHMILRHSINMGYEVYAQLEESLQIATKIEPLDSSAAKDMRCPSCPFITDDEQAYKEHSLVHSQSERFSCVSCFKSYKYKSDLRVHIRKEHQHILDESAVTCAEASSNNSCFTNYMIDRKDDNQSSRQKRFRCTLCSYTSWRKDDTKRHIYTKHSSYLKSDAADKSPMHTEAAETLPDGDTSSSIQVYRCDLCNFFTSSQSYLTSHRRGHDSYKRWRCPQCGHRSNWKSDVLKHMRKKHPGSDVTVDKMEVEEAKATLDSYMEQYPERRFKGANNPQTEMKQQFMYKCSLCPCMSMLRTSVSKHIRKKHAGQDASILVTELGQPKEDNIDVDEPRMSSTPKSDGISSFRAEELAGSFRYACGDCSKRCVHAWGVKRHYAYCHPGSQPRIFDTQAGDEEVKEVKVDELVSNRRAIPDAGNEGSKVDVAESNSLLTAQSDTSDASPMTSKTNFIGKIAKMTKVRPFKCSICQRRSNWKWDMKKHLRTVHPGIEGHVITLTVEEALKEPVVNVPLLRTSAHPPKNLKFQCSACGKRSAYSGDIRKHIISKHPDFTVVVLNLDKREKNNSASYGSKDSSVIYATDDSVDIMEGSEQDAAHLDGAAQDDESIQQKSISRYAWICKKCTFTHKSRHVMLEHLSVHRVKAYSCKLCDCSASYRSALYRHLRSTHACNNYSMCSEMMQYKRLETLENENTDAVVQEVVYYCRVCAFETKSQAVVRRHIREKHQLTNPAYYGSRTADGDVQLLNPEEIAKPPKRHACDICPYSTNKLNLLKIHKVNHKPHPSKQYKCKFCPYYVSFPRLVQQHMTLHTNVHQKALTVSGKLPSMRRRHSCDKCPYMTNSKNDYLFHKQFHRQRPNAIYKCTKCDYWVTLKRLLTQHMKLHSCNVVTVKETTDLSPSKSDLNETLLNLSPIEITELKQKIITSKILPSVESNQKNADYLPKLHKCRHCPYSHFRARNVRFHERMHGWRHTNKPLYKCNICDYYVGSKGLLSHHMKVHSPDVTEPEGGVVVEGESKVDSVEGEEILESIRFKRYPCEKCPFATSKRSQFLRHSELHASKQRFVCKFCDYSVATNVLLNQHQKLHMAPNYNLLSTQSVSNLQHLPVVTAEVAIEATLNSNIGKMSDLVHDDLELYENLAPDTDNEMKKLYRCDRCPYTNVRRDYLLSHLKFHMFSSDLKCPHCTYSVAKPHLLAQHLKVHFTPLPELTEWLNASGLKARLAEVTASPTTVGEKDFEQEGETTHSDADNAPSNISHNENKQQTCPAETSGGVDTPVTAEECHDDAYICQYCDREFETSRLMVEHEALHLIGYSQGESVMAEVLVQ